MGHYFEVVGISGEIGAGKPKAKAFTHTLKQFGIAPELAVMVGDNPVNDVVGAQQVGIKGVWVNRDGAPATDGIAPDGEIKDLLSLREVVEKL